MKILITGGHLTPALSFIDYAMEKGDEIIFIGRSHASKKHNIKSKEESEIKKRGLTYEQIDTFKLHRHNKILSLIKLPKLFTSIIRAKKIIKETNPDIIVSFGGYLAVPVVVAAKKLNLPVFTHEQTRHMGLANKFIAKYANIVGISWKDTKNLPSHKNIVFTGNPIRKQIKSKAKKPSWAKSNKPIIYVTGGNQGSLIINQSIQRLIPKLSKSFFVIHQCGGSGHTNYLQELNKSKNDLSDSQKHNYVIKKWYDANEVSWILDNATCVISRSGANTISELIYKSVPSILIPLPFSSQNEQLTNAKILTNNGAAALIIQNKLSDDLLLQTIKEVQKNYHTYKNNFDDLRNLIIVDAEKQIYKIASELNEKNSTKKTTSKY